ncbi:MAG: PQQ-dependent sugar dehydrogenase [Pseudomonadota bacterium]
MRTRPLATFAILLGFAPTFAPVQAHAQDETITTDEGLSLNISAVVDGLQHPWGVDTLPNGELLVTEREGTMRVIFDGAASNPVGGLPQIAVGGQGGLLDVAVDPDFGITRRIFFSFSEAGDGGFGTAVATGLLADWETGAPRLTEVETIFTMNRKSRGGRHFGSRIAFAPDGTLFITTGDRGDAPRSQDFSDHAGAVIRINKDGTVPGDNPFIGQSGVAPELYSKGHRNIQGADIDPQTGLLWTVEHGARGGDEINQPQPGLNYGWPVISYGRHYSGLRIGEGTEKPGLEQPKHYWDPSIAPSGLAVYDGDMFPEWRGDLLVGALRDQLMTRLERDASGNVVAEEQMFQGEFGRIRDIEVADDGSLFIAIDNNPGQILHVTRANPT